MKQFEVWLINLDPTVGSEMTKTRPCVVISPDEMNQLNTRLVAPLTGTTHRKWAFRVHSNFKGIKGQIALDQMRAVDKTRGNKHLGNVNKATASSIKKILQAMFA